LLETVMPDRNVDPLSEDPVRKNMGTRSTSSRSSGRRAESKLPAHIQRLSRLVGSWKVTIRWSVATHQLVGGPREIEFPVEINWLDSGPWLHYRFGAAHWLIGGDEDDPEFVVLYTDDRPAPRLYQMTFERDVWKIWRDAPGFRQRFEGKITEKGRTIVAHWDKAEGNKSWARDFDLVFRR
jgi:hypothetical protein